MLKTTKDLHTKERKSNIRSSTLNIENQVTSRQYA